MMQKRMVGLEPPNQPFFIHTRKLLLSTPQQLILCSQLLQNLKFLPRFVLLPLGTNRTSKVTCWHGDGFLIHSISVERFSQTAPGNPKTERLSRKQRQTRSSCSTLPDLLQLSTATRFSPQLVSAWSQFASKTGVLLDRVLPMAGLSSLRRQSWTCSH